MPADYKPDPTGGQGGKSALPLKYGSPTGSGLTATVGNDAANKMLRRPMHNGWTL